MQIILDVIVVVLEKFFALHVMSTEFGTGSSLTHQIVLLQQTRSLATADRKVRKYAQGSAVTHLLCGEIINHCYEFAAELQPGLSVNEL